MNSFIKLTFAEHTLHTWKKYTVLQEEQLQAANRATGHEVCRYIKWHKRILDPLYSLVWLC